MLLSRNSSWRQRGRPQPVDPPQDLSELGSWYGDPCELDWHVAAMAHDVGTNFDGSSVRQ